jgi:hypothetical protein
VTVAGTSIGATTRSTHMRATVLAMAALLAALTACGTQEPPPAGQDDPGIVDDEGVDGEAPTPDDDVGLPDIPVDQAIVEAGGEFDADPEDIQVVSAERVTWSDGALGCPQPGEMYSQALVEGYRIILEVDGQEVHYHGTPDEPPFHCEDPQEPAEVHGGEATS